MVPSLRLTGRNSELMVPRETVEQWLREFEFEPEDSQVENPGDFAWSLSFQGPVFRTVVAQHKVDFNRVEMRIVLAVSPNHAEVLTELDPDMRDRFMFDLRFALLQLPVGFSLTVDDDTQILEHLTFGYNLMEEPLQRAGFFRRLHQLQSAGILAAQMLQKLARFREW